MSAVTRQRRRRILDKACSNTRGGPYEPANERARVLGLPPAPGCARHRSGAQGPEHDTPRFTPRRTSRSGSAWPAPSSAATKGHDPRLRRVTRTTMRWTPPIPWPTGARSAGAAPCCGCRYSNAGRAFRLRRALRQPGTRRDVDGLRRDRMDSGTVGRRRRAAPGAGRPGPVSPPSQPHGRCPQSERLRIGPSEASDRRDPDSPAASAFPRSFPRAGAGCAFPIARRPPRRDSGFIQSGLHARVDDRGVSKTSSRGPEPQ